MALNSPGLSGWGASSAGGDLPIRVAGSSTRFSGSLQIAAIIDPEATGLTRALSSGAAQNLEAAFRQLNPSEQNSLRERWGRSLDELFSLANEPDATIFHHGLLEVGHRLEENDQLDLASVVYSTLVGNSPRPPLNLRGGEGSVSASSESSPPLNLRGGREGLFPGVLARAQSRLNAINGVGDWRARLAFNLERLPSNATRWDMLFAMGGAGLVFRGVRLAATARWASSFESAFALNAAATSTAFIGETVAFTSLGRLFGTMAGNHYDWSAEGTFNEWAGGAAMLLGLKAMGGMFGNLSERWATGESAFARVTRAVAPQAGMFSGIVLGNRLAELGGFHPERHGDTWLVDGLTTLLEFNVAGRLQRAGSGPGLASLEARMEAYTRSLGSPGSGSRRATGLRGIWGEVFSSSVVTPEGIQFNDFGTTHDVSHISQASSKTGGRRGRGGTERMPGTPSGSRQGRSDTVAYEERSSPPSSADPASRPTEVQDIAHSETEVFSPPPPTVSTPGVLSAAEAAQLGGAKTEARVEVIPTGARQGILPPPEVSPLARATVGDTADPVELAASAPSPARIHTTLKANYLPGARLGPEGRYVVVELVGKGGFGEVYKVHDTALDRYAAIKILQDPMRADLIQMFLAERQLTARLDPRYAVVVYDAFHTEAGQPTQVMEFLDGYNFHQLLRARFRGEPLPENGKPTNIHELMSLPNRFQMVADMLEALDSAHERGVVHRDVKPENIQWRRNGQIQFLDFGIGKATTAVSEEVRMSFPPPADSMAASRGALQSQTTIAGTRGYMAPERWGKVEDYRSVDAFAMAVVGYEMISGVHPWAEFVPNPNFNEATRNTEPEMIVSREPDSDRTRMGQFAGIMPEGVRREPPPFRQVIAGELPSWVEEVEAVIRRGLRFNPSDRYPSLREMREAWLLSSARAEYKSLVADRAKMESLREKINQRWIASRDGLVIPPEGEEHLYGPIEELVQRKRAWERDVSYLLTQLAGTIGNERAPGTWLEAHRLMAELNFEILKDGEASLSQATLNEIIQQIRAHDRPELGEEEARISIALERPVQIDFAMSDIISGRAVRGPLKVRITPFRNEVTSEGRETRNFVLEPRSAIEGSWAALQKELRLPVGYFQIEFEHPGFAPMSVPLRLTYEDARRAGPGHPFLRTLDFVPRALVPEGFVVVQGGKAVIGHNYFEEPDITTGPSFPMRQIDLETVIMQRHPVTVEQYLHFVEDSLRLGVPLETIAKVVPHTTYAGTAKAGRRIKAAVMTAIRQNEVPILGREEGYYWEIRARGMGKKRSYSVLDPTTHSDPFGDPIYRDQPVQAINYHATLLYADWLASRLSLPGKLEVPPIEYLEANARNHIFGWLYPWGQVFSSSCVVCRDSFPPNTEHKSIQRIGTHPTQPVSRDRSVSGTLDPVGNSREFSSTVAEPGTVYVFGGTIRHNKGVAFRPTTRSMMGADAVMDGTGAFRLMSRFPRRP